MDQRIKKESGYTIIETMIAVSIFIVVVMTGMTALINANLVHEKSQDMRSIVDGLSFAMEEISRNLKVGYNYHCIDETPDGLFSGSNTHSCENGSGISFETSLPGGGRWTYFLDYDPADGKMKVFKYKDGGTTSFPLTPDEVAIDSVSGFSVLGAEPPADGDQQQPFVTIRLVGTIDWKGTNTPFSLQTSASHRLIDI